MIPLEIVCRPECRLTGSDTTWSKLCGIMRKLGPDCLEQIWGYIEWWRVKCCSFWGGYKSSTSHILVGVFVRLLTVTYGQLPSQWKLWIYQEQWTMGQKAILIIHRQIRVWPCLATAEMCKNILLIEIACIVWSFVEYLRVINWWEVRCYQKLNTIFCNQQECPRCEMFSVLVLNSKHTVQLRVAK